MQRIPLGQGGRHWLGKCCCTSTQSKHCWPNSADPKGEKWTTNTRKSHDERRHKRSTNFPWFSSNCEEMNKQVQLPKRGWGIRVNVMLPFVHPCSFLSHLRWRKIPGLLRLQGKSEARETRSPRSPGGDSSGNTKRTNGRRCGMCELQMASSRRRRRTIEGAWMYTCGRYDAEIHEQMTDDCRPGALKCPVPFRKFPSRS